MKGGTVQTDVCNKLCNKTFIKEYLHTDFGNVNEFGALFPGYRMYVLPVRGFLYV